ncbi:Protein CASP [Vitis vinifera]|uniref:Protein CASP n=1 Tax=Vitis vinifera TaxID=29760 RepID=A0A438JYQ5_VITVI|nr:Protein CASP [Vitis vinifera]
MNLVWIMKLSGLLRSKLQSANDENGQKKSDNLDSNSILENSLSAKEKIISELNMELHNIEITLSNEREQHVNEIKRLNALLNEKVVDGDFEKRGDILVLHVTALQAKKLMAMRNSNYKKQQQWKKQCEDLALEEIKKELLARPTAKLVDDLRKKVKILQVVPSLLYISCLLISMCSPMNLSIKNMGTHEGLVSVFLKVT